ncbi:hypothetical protein LINPERHAP1_LOCUS8889 [Linum perenne]
MQGYAWRWIYQSHYLGNI